MESYDEKCYLVHRCLRRPVLLRAKDYANMENFFTVTFQHDDDDDGLDGDQDIIPCTF